MPTMPPRIGAHRLWRAALLLLVAAWLALGALTLLLLTAALMPDSAARELLRCGRTISPTRRPSRREEGRAGA